MTKTASDAKEITICDNNTVNSHHINWSDFLKRTWVSRLDLYLILYIGELALAS